MKKIIIPFLAIVVIACLLLVLEKDFLWKIQEQNLFLCSWQFFKEQMVVPGGLLTWLGTFFTQFHYHPWLGVTLLAAWWMLLVWLIERTFRLDGWWHLLTVVPLLFILVTIVDMGYWVYILKLRGHFFVTTIGVTAVTALLWAFRVMSDKPIVYLIPLLTCAIGYPLLGIYGLGATLIMAIWIWRLKPRWVKALAVSAVGVLSIIVIPQICYRQVFYQINQDNIYFAALPLYFIREEYHTFYVPFYLLLLFFAGLVFIPSMREGNRKPIEVKTKDKKGKKVSVSSSLWQPVVVGLILVAAIVYTVCYWYRDENFQHELAMQHSIEQLDWEGVLREAATQEDEPTRAIVMMRNIALARLGRQANEMFRYKNGSKRINAPFDMRMMLVVGPLVYYHYGKVNDCYRLSMEMGVEYDWRAEYLKNLARCAVLNGEWKLARKFIGLLRQTTFFGDWADRLSQLMEKPEDIASTEEMGFITHMMHYDSEITSDWGMVEEFLMKRLSASTYTDDPIFQEQTLLASLFTRDVNMFWHHLSDYVKLHPDGKLPKHLQEAAILFGTLEDRQELDQWPFDDSVRENFRQFFQIMPRYDKMEVEPVRKALAPLFGHTYYYYYYLMDNLPQY